jgi:hypothetical protein
MSNKITNNLTELNDSVKNLVQVKIDLLKLSLLKKLSIFFSHLFSYMIVILFSVLILMFGAAAFSIWYGEAYGSFTEGFLISTGIFVLLAAIFIIFRKQLLTNALLRRFSEALFEDDNKK